MAHSCGYFHTIFRLLDLGYYKDAIILGQKLITENPKSYDAHYCLAIGYYEIGNFRKSLEHAKEMEELASSEEELALAYNRLGLAYDNLGYIDLAMMYQLSLCPSKPTLN